MTSILIQIKTNINKRHFSGDLGYMDPFDVGLFSDGDAPLPAIRIVFVLGSDDPDVTFPARKILVLPAGSFCTTFGARGCRQLERRSRASVMIYSHIRSGAVGSLNCTVQWISRVDFLPNGNSLEGETRDVERETWQVVTLRIRRSTRIRRTSKKRRMVRELG